MAIPTVIRTARDIDITDAQLERLSLEFKQHEVDTQLQLPEGSSSRTLDANARDVKVYQDMETTALADAAALRQKVVPARLLLLLLQMCCSCVMCCLC